MPTHKLSQVMISIDMEKPGAKPIIECELTPKELQLIGLITVQWAHLEHCLFITSLDLAEQVGYSDLSDIKNLSFTRRLQGFRKLCELLDSNEAARWSKVADRIANLEGTRHKVTHGLWLWKTADELSSIISLRPPYNFNMKINAKRLEKLGNQIGELIFELSFPNGLADVEPIPPIIRASATKRNSSRRR